MKNKLANKFFDNKIPKSKKCDEKGCVKEGTFVAPKSPNSKEVYYFCIKHIKLYNKRWNFFAGKSQAEIYNFQKNDFFEGRPTFPFSKGTNSNIKFDFEFNLNKDKIKFERSRENFKPKIFPNSDKEIKGSMKVFNIQDNFTELDLKKKYKELVKKYHPDVKNKVKNKEKMIKKINKAYNILHNYLKTYLCK